MVKRGMIAGMAAVFMMNTAGAACAQEPSAFGREIQLMDALDSQERGVLLSNVSMETALAMLLEGAGTETKEEIEAFLNAGVEEVRRSEREFIEGIKENDGFAVVNALWHNTGQKLLEDYISDLSEFWDAEMIEADFSDTAAAAERINAWCEEKTRGTIPVIVRANQLIGAEDVLINATYLKATWVDPLRLLGESEFHGLGGDERTEMLCGSADRYYENEKAIAFGKDYNENMTFVGILPKEEGDFALGDLDIELLLKTGTEDYGVSIQLPKFEIVHSCSLAEVLKENGLPITLSGDADLSGIAEGTEVQISDIIQKTYVKVDENGTEAAAATAVIMLETAREELRESRQVVLDRPFAFLIMDQNTGRVLFTGKVGSLA